MPSSLLRHAASLRRHLVKICSFAVLCCEDDTPVTRQITFRLFLLVERRVQGPYGPGVGSSLWTIFFSQSASQSGAGDRIYMEIRVASNTLGPGRMFGKNPPHSGIVSLHLPVKYRENLPNRGRGTAFPPCEPAEMAHSVIDQIHG